ncbi:MAG: glycine betaine/L-proline ABC transporter ATP-binding protein [Clostridia bacterium]|jgi:glycine betaine/proline transport system ATP-binding protein|nr:glycine betaine/L-proline ABC transporter ATP-binding protein [Clostridia bacterium]MDH7572946.1 glycine betaine/L-proline ABC transporter ATP-binding protein [Clostridia bacterium]
MAKIIVEQLTKVFGRNPERALQMLNEGHDPAEVFRSTGLAVAVWNASLCVEQGELFVIIGLSGSGKSTLIRCLNRLVEPTAGRIVIDGEDVTVMDGRQLRQFRQRRLGMVFQRFALFPHRTVLENVEFGLEIQGVDSRDRRERAMAMLELVGLSDWAQYKPDALSGGMQQRVGLARALASDPDILLMDEPFSALDPLIRRRMQDELLQLQQRLGKTIIFVTHDLDEALKLGDRVAIMRAGQIVQVSSPEEVLARPADEYVAEFTRDVNPIKVLKARNVMWPPDPLVFLKDGPRVALRQMQERGLSSAFVVDKNRRLKGLLTVDAALAAIRQGQDNLEDLVEADFPRAHPDTSLEELISTAVSSRYPIAVVNGDGVLQGIIARVAVLSALIGPQGGEERAVS